MGFTNFGSSGFFLSELLAQVNNALPAESKWCNFAWAFPFFPLFCLKANTPQTVSNSKMLSRKRKKPMVNGRHKGHSLLISCDFEANFGRSFWGFLQQTFALCRKLAQRVKRDPDANKWTKTWLQCSPIGRKEKETFSSISLNRTKISFLL